MKLNIVRPIDYRTASIETIATLRPPRTWEQVFIDAAPDLHHTSEILKEQEIKFGGFYPLKEDIFSAFNRTPLYDVKCVIVGQDPYPQMFGNKPRATGLAFSVRREDAIPSSLQNIYSELAATVKGFVKPTHGCLDEWAANGVLLLNTCLTVRPGEPGSHGEIWLGFMNRVFKAIAAANPYCVYMLWGKEAQKIKPMLGERSIILEAAHPSGLSARRGFFGCNHFNLCNESLIRQGKTPIDWRITNQVSAPPVPTNMQRHVDTTKIVPVNIGHLAALIPAPVVPLPMMPKLTEVPINEPKSNIVPIIPVIAYGKPPSPPSMSIPLIPVRSVTDGTHQSPKVTVVLSK